MVVKCKQFAISDTHFNHERIITLAKRPFATIDQMNATLIKRWNAVVSKTDTVYILGDFILSYGGKSTFEDIIAKLNGKKFMAKGNHDRYTNHWLLNHGIDFVADKFSIEINGKNFCMVHNPFDVDAAERKRHDIVLHGHIHNDGNDSVPAVFSNCYNVNVEMNNYAPVRIENIIKSMYSPKVA